MSESQPFWTVLSGVFFAMGFIPYVCGEIKLAKASWIVWASLDSIVLAGMFVQGTVNGQILGAVIGSCVVAVLALKYGMPGWTKLYKLCLVGAGLSIALWWVFSNPILGIVASLSVIFLRSIPIFVSTWQNPTREDDLTWFVFWLSSLAAVFAIPAWTVADAAQPITFFIIGAVMRYLLDVQPALMRWWDLRNDRGWSSKPSFVSVCSDLHRALFSDVFAGGMWVLIGVSVWLVLPTVMPVSVSLFAWFGLYWIATSTMMYFLLRLVAKKRSALSKS